ncbi:MAG: 50S ribosomal protein L2 [uncultured bacterium (gcode 4)]|uniref:50S ribosomal protein L2 n=1 Tax=uncultured bacterium (gcode 4) TaxID=1234023 RepID=K1XKF1_9BACT|nr:MAG: 50S ribosomal protein L2 [uncultured bacterium (gcode 4)]
MALKNYKPYTPSRRYMIWYDFSDLTKKRPERSLTISKKRTGGRNNSGSVTSRSMGGGHKRLYRLIDFKGYDKANIPAKIASVEYDPYRTSRIALLHFADGEKRYVLAWKTVKVGDTILCWDQAPIAHGNRKQLKDIPEWLNVFNLEVTPLSSWKLIKSAWSYASIVGKDNLLKIVFIKLPSGEVRKFNENCYATIGEIGNDQHQHVVIGKAGRQRRLGKKPHVLGKNMNPCDHPHGGWEWHSSIGLKKWQKSFTGKRVTPGIKTRKNKKTSSKFIISRRTKN